MFIFAVFEVFLDARLKPPEIVLTTIFISRRKLGTLDRAQCQNISIMKDL
jgi:hypothetical protein